MKNRCVYNKWYKLNNGEYKPVNEQCKGGKMIGKIYRCSKGFKVNKGEYRKEEGNCKGGKMKGRKCYCHKRQIFQGNQCKRNDKCLPGYKRERGRCVKYNKCSPGYKNLRGRCVKNCPPGYKTEREDVKGLWKYRIVTLVRQIIFKVKEQKLNLPIWGVKKIIRMIKGE